MAVPWSAQRFLSRAESMYGNVPYHNRLHGADVTQGIVAILGDIGFETLIDPLGGFCLVLSALVHDLGHDGRNNAFHVAIRDDLALTYNDRSVQESYHISTAFKLLIREPDTNLLCTLSEEQLTVMRKQMIDCVLGTDMEVHFKQVSDFKTLVERLGTKRHAWEGDTKAISSLQVLLLHAADISNTAKPAALAMRWTELLKEELFMQGDEEKVRQIPVSPLCDRATCKWASSQVGFIQFIVQPTFTVLGELMPRVHTCMLGEVAANIAIWEEQKAAEEDAHEIRNSLPLSGAIRLGKDC